MERVRTPPAQGPRDGSPERRGSTRFALSLELRYAVLDRHTPLETGSGRTIDVSSSGLSFNADRPLLIGQKLKVSIDWPVLLGSVQLQLIISGGVVRSNGTMTALQIERHEFRTRRGGVMFPPRSTATDPS